MSRDCELLAPDIESATGEHIGVNTMKRLLGFIADERTPRTSTLDVIARYLGFDNWEALRLFDENSSNSTFYYYNKVIRRCTAKKTEAHSETAKEAPATVQKEDTLALRRELQRLIGPRFKQTLGHYSDSIYNRINQERFSQEWIDFEESLMPLYTQVWEKFKDRVSKHTMQSEWCQTIQYYRVPQFWQMMRNEPGHDSFYDDKAFEYYKYPC